MSHKPHFTKACSYLKLGVNHYYCKLPLQSTKEKATLSGKSVRPEFPSRVTPLCFGDIMEAEALQKQLSGGAIKPAIEPQGWEASKAMFSVQACQVDNRWTLTLHLLYHCSPQHGSKCKMETWKWKKVRVSFFFSRKQQYTDIIFYYNRKHMRHFTIQDKNRIALIPLLRNLTSR